MNFSKINCVKFFEIIKFLRFIGLILPNFCRLLNLIFNDHLLILIYLDKYIDLKFIFFQALELKILDI